ncbi:hypothetical protein OG612_42430 (plasmid) [Streptomyces sp. NBC_01527]|uniref:hypothetical protein n=1 Tax=unclassified Streptomyces TaxID=2593676 RepID=UPI002E0DB995|nr:hypothetical protein OG763_45775 [Streptomyces sp. NBC_01230]
MSYEHRDLNLIYEPDKSWAHFVLYTEPNLGVTSAALNGTVSIESETPHVREWVDRLQPCEPNPLHTTLVPNRKILDLFQPCVHDDKDSPSAVGGSGCVCYQTFSDPEFGLPVVADHYRTRSGNTETWKYHTYAPLDLRTDDTFASLILEPGRFWIRTAAGLLSLLPEEDGRGYGVGYGGGGPHELARYIDQLIDSDGRTTSAAGLRPRDSRPDPQVLAWVSSKEATGHHELSLDDLKKIRRS